MIVYSLKPFFRPAFILAFVPIGCPRPTISNDCVKDACEKLDIWGRLSSLSGMVESVRKLDCWNKLKDEELNIQEVP